MEKRAEHYAFALGYLAGREEGIESNPYNPEAQPKLYRAYREGYEWGVSDYCLIEHPEEVNQ